MKNLRLLIAILIGTILGVLISFLTIDGIKLLILYKFGAFRGGTLLANGALFAGLVIGNIVSSLLSRAIAIDPYRPKASTISRLSTCIIVVIIVLARGGV